MAKLSSLTDIPSVRAYLERIGAEPRSFRTAIITETSGKYWRDLATIRFDKSGLVGDVPDEYAPTEDELKIMAVECGQFDWPEVKHVNHWPEISTPFELREAPTEKVFVFRDLQGNILMKQLRGDESKGEPKYVSYSFWNDDVVRKMEPDGLLPLWGLEQITKYTTVFLHEGAKAARHMADLVGGTIKERNEFKKHPWHHELDQAAHLGWIGGAQNPHRTNFEVLRKEGITRVYIVSDNDPDGVSAVPKIAHQLRCPTYHVQFTKRWPASFDLADPFPDDLFRTINGIRHYVGDAFRDCAHPATWATDLVSVEKGRKIGVLRQHFKRQWVYVEEVDVYVCADQPDIIRPAGIFNNMVRAFSHVANTAGLLLKDYDGRTVKLSYKPDQKPGMITTDGTSSINVFTPTRIRPAEGNPEPFLEYLRHLIPHEGDRKEVERWCATLIARPDIRMEFGLLLMSEKQGVGKNTLGAKILAPLVGMHNTSFPSETDIVDSQFNGWLARKRLVFVGEVYSGQSWKAYNKLKSLVTDKEVDVNEKHQRAYRIDSWAHFCVCSNAILALKMEETDRRWLVPTVTEVGWPKTKFKAFYDWIEGGGLSIIMAWAKGFGDYIAPGDSAPMTTRKRRAIEDSLSEDERNLKEICQIGIEDGDGFAISSKEALAAAKRNGTRNLYLSAHDLGKVMVSAGMSKHDGKVKIDGSLHILFLSPAALNQIASLDDPAEVNDRLRTLEKAGRLRIEKM